MGPLELEGLGIFNAAKELLRDYSGIIVIREHLVDEITEKLEISPDEAGIIRPWRDFLHATGTQE